MPASLAGAYICWGIPAVAPADEAFLAALPECLLLGCFWFHATCVWSAQALINGRPEETTALLMRLCTSGEGLGQGGEPAPVTAQVADFAHLFADRCAVPPLFP